MKRQAASLKFTGPALAAMLALSFAGQVSARGEDFPAPPGATTSWVSDDMVLNGMHMKVRHFQTDRSVDYIQRYYRQLWRSPAIEKFPGYTEAQSGEWQLITRLERYRYLSVQVQPLETGSGAWGYLGESRSGSLEDGLEPGKGFPKMRDSQVFTDLKSDDPGVSSRTLMIANTFSAASNASYYRNHFSDQGWTPQVDRQNDGAWVQTWQRGSETVNLVITEGNDFTVIVANSASKGVF